MLTLQINNPDIETIFLEGFNSNKEKFLEFIQDSYQHMKHVESFERSIRQAKLQESGELEELSLDAMIVLNKGLQFELKIPNDDTEQTLQELEIKKGKSFKNVDELFEDLDS